MSSELYNESVPENPPLKSNKSLRVVDSDLYEWLIERFEEQRVHSYDVQIRVEEVMDNEHGPIVCLRILFGENFERTFEKKVSKEDLTINSEPMQSLVSEFSTACEEGLISDYRKFMQPHT